jgi:hypothetical protein
MCLLNKKLPAARILVADASEVDAPRINEVILKYLADR